MLFHNVWAGTAFGSLEFPKLTFSSGVNLRAGVNKIALLSIAVGLPVCSLYLFLSHACMHTQTKLVFYRKMFMRSLNLSLFYL